MTTAVGTTAGTTTALLRPVAGPHKATLPIVLAGIFMAALDFFIVNVAIPSISADLSASAAAIEWVVAGYGLAYGAGLITAGRLGDLYGRRRVLTLALALFTVASAACGLAPSAAFLVSARIVQGVAAALLTPQVLAVLGTAYAGEARARAFNAYGLTLGLAAVFGQLIGGLLIRADLFGLDWRACFLINIPVGVAALALTLRLVPESRAPARARPDLPGMLLVTLALVATVLPLIEGREQGWPAWTWLSLAAALALFGVTWLYLSRRSAPLIDLTLFRERAFAAGLLTQLAFWMGQASFFLVFALYVQLGHGLDALGAGLIFTPLGAGYLATSLTARHLAARLGRQVIAVGALTMVAGEILLRVTVAHIGVTGHVAWLTPALVIHAAGMGMAVAPLAATILARIPANHAGAAAGVLSTVQQVGNALGVAIVGILFYGAVDRGYAYAFDLSLTYLIGVALGVAALVQLLPTRQRSDRRG
jgi:EmrB/QacA subfamily drug resistance transporter